MAIHESQKLGAEHSSSYRVSNRKKSVLQIIKAAVSKYRLYIRFLMSKAAPLLAPLSPFSHTVDALSPSLSLIPFFVSYFSSLCRFPFLSVAAKMKNATAYIFEYILLKKKKGLPRLPSKLKAILLIYCRTISCPIHLFPRYFNCELFPDSL